MGLTSIKIGMIVAVCSGVVVIGAAIMLLAYPGLNCLTFSRKPRQSCVSQPQTCGLRFYRQHCSSFEFVEGVVEQYGDLYIPPNRKPVHVGIGIINHMLVASSLPLYKIDYATVTAAERGHAPRLSLHLSGIPSLALPEQVDQHRPTVRTVSDVVSVSDNDGKILKGQVLTVVCKDPATKKTFDIASPREHRRVEEAQS